MKKQLLTLLTLLFCVALSAQSVDVRVCHADKFIAGCTVYDRADGDQTGIPVDLGDKSYTLNLSWGTPATFAYTDSFAVGGNYLFGCRTLTTAGTYDDTLTTSTGCDSIIVLTLTEYTPVPPCEEVTFAYTDSMAIGGTYIFQCQVLTEAGEYRDTLVNADGCDSIIVLTLTEYTPVPPCEEVTFAYTDSMAVGGTYIFNCQVLTEAGEYRDTLVNADGCDSIIVLTLTEYTPVPPCEEVTFAYTDSMATGGTYIFNCQVLTEAGEYRDTVVKADGCDSIIVLTLTEYTPCEEVTFAYTDSMATGGTYIFQCQVLTEAGEYRDTLVKADGCDSIIVLTLKEYTPVPPCEEVTFAYTDSMATGGTYIFNCQVLTEAGEYRDTLVKADGCDSIIVLTLTEYSAVIQNDTLRDTVLVNLCLGEPFTDRLNVTYYPTQDTVVLDTVMIRRDTTLTLIHTVDSIYRYELTVQQPKDSTTTATICAGEAFTWFGNDYSVADTYFDTLHYTTGCDSICGKLILTVQQPKDSTTTATICAGEAFTWFGNDYSVADTYFDTLHYTTGCDSICGTLILTVQQPKDSTTTATICAGEAFTWFGNDYSVADTYFDTLHYTTGCDSICGTLVLTVQQPKDSTTTATICAGEAFTWFGNDYSVADIYYDTLRYTTGCDSICGKLILTVQQPKDSLTTVTICAGEAFTWFGNDYSVADTYYDTLHYTTGCDSICGTLVLTVQSRYVDELPALVKDDSWLLMIHRRSIREDYGIDFTADQVHWYRVEGEVDEYPYGEDNDVQVGTGDYYTIAQKMSGKYYALLDVDVSWKNACALFARTVILDCDNASGPILSPTIVPAGGLMKLTNLQEGELTINVYTPAGQKVRSESVKVNNEHDIYAERVCGVYLLQVTNVGKTNVFKYVVTQ